MDDESNPRRRLLQKLAAAAAGAWTVETLADVRSDPADTALPPLLRTNPEPVGESPPLYPVRKGEVGVVAPEFPYGHGSRFGIKTDGTDTTAEVIHWRDSILGMGTYADAYGLPHPLCKAVLPSGLILVREAGALLSLPSGGSVIWAYVIEGEGLQTTVLYDPQTPGPLLFASNRLFGLFIRNINFEARDDAAPVDWLRSESAGKQQFFTFENLGFGGKWRAGVRLSSPPAEAGDCNSEFKFDRINIGGAFTDAFLTDAENDAQQSSQFLNYWFSNINMTGWMGRLVRLRRGGHVAITNLDVSGYKPAEESFVIDLPELAGRNDSCHSLIVRNARFEPLSEHARFLRCRWDRGTVAIDGYDDVVWRNTEHLNFEIRASNAASDRSFGKSGEGISAAGAQYSFVNGRFTGIHRFLFRGAGGTDADNVAATIVYRNCEFCGPHDDAAARNIHSFVRLVPDGDGSLLWRPHVRFRSCRLEAVPDHVTDWDLGVQGAHPSSQAPIKALRFGTSDRGRLPSGAAARIVLAPGALVLRVTWILPAGHAPNRPYRFELSNDFDDDRRQLLAVLEGDDLSARAARVDLLAYETVPASLPEKFDPVRSATLVLRETRAPGVHPSAQCIVEYI